MESIKSEEPDVVIDALKSKYFALAASEVIGATPLITQKLDNLESAIRELSKKGRE